MPWRPERPSPASSVTVETAENIDNTVIPSFTVGTKDPVTVEATNTNRNMPSNFAITATNTLGVPITCDLNALQEEENPKEAPSCHDVFSLEGLPAVETTVQDLKSGLRRIELVFVKNAKVFVSGGSLMAPVELAYPPGTNFIEFDPPTLEPVVIRAEKINLDERATVLVEVFDNDIPESNSAICDPELHQVIVGAEGYAEETLQDIFGFDRFFTIQNGNGSPGSGLALLILHVPDTMTEILKLQEGEVKQFEVAEGVLPDLYELYILGIGRPGSQASIAISNQPSDIAPMTPSHVTTLQLRQKSPETNYGWGWESIGR